MRRAYLSHPKAMLALQMHPASMPNAERLTDRVLGLLRQACLSDTDAAVAYEAMENYTVGTTLFDAGATEESLEGWRRVYRSARADVGTPRERVQAVPSNPTGPRTDPRRRTRPRISSCDDASIEVSIPQEGPAARATCLTEPARTSTSR